MKQVKKQKEATLTIKDVTVNRDDLIEALLNEDVINEDDFIKITKACVKRLTDCEYGRGDYYLSRSGWCASFGQAMLSHTYDFITLRIVRNCVVPKRIKVINEIYETYFDEARLPSEKFRKILAEEEAKREAKEKAKLYNRYHNQ